MNDCAPFVTKEIKKPFAPQMNDHIREAMNQRDDTHEKLKCDRHNITLLEQYKREKKRVSSPMQKAKLNITLMNFGKVKATCQRLERLLKKLFPTLRIILMIIVLTLTLTKLMNITSTLLILARIRMRELRRSSMVQTCPILGMQMQF